MNQNSFKQTSSETIYTIIGIVTGAILALIFAKTGNPGMIGVGAALGLLIGKSLSRRNKRDD